MAEYFPLLDRAVSGLTEQTAEARQSIYERARAALIGQLRRMEPPIPEDDITRESTALDEAIARVESRFESGRKVVDDSPAPARGERPSAETKREPAGKREEPAPPASPPRSPAAASVRVSPPRLPTGAPPVVPPPSRERPVVGQRPAPALETPPRRVPPASPNAPPPSRGTRPVMALRPTISAPPAEAKDAGGLPAAGGLAPPSGRAFGDPVVAADSASPDTTTDTPRTTDGFADALDDAARRSGEVQNARARDTSLRPPAPRPPQARRFGWPTALLSILGMMVVIGIAIAAYRMRDTPEQVVATRSAAAPIAVGSADKSAERASPAASDAGDASETASGASVPAPVGQSEPDATPGGPSIAVAQRAALLVDAPDDPKRVRTYLGTVVWHLDSVSPGQGQPLATAVKADIDIPEAKLKVTMVMQKNPEPQLPASHTIEFHFLPQGGNTLGGVKQINVPEMRRDDEAPTGDPLAGVPVAITDNYFLVGLARGAPETQNMRLVGDRNWFDVGFLFTSGKLGKLTFEKGSVGQHTFEDALKAWR